MKYLTNFLYNMYVVCMLVFIYITEIFEKKPK